MKRTHFLHQVNVEVYGDQIRFQGSVLGLRLLQKSLNWKISRYQMSMNVALFVVILMKSVQRYVWLFRSSIYSPQIDSQCCSGNFKMFLTRAPYPKNRWEKGLKVPIYQIIAIRLHLTVRLVYVIETCQYAYISSLYSLEWKSISIKERWGMCMGRGAA